MPDYCDITVTVPKSHEHEASAALMDMNIISEQPPHLSLTEAAFSFGGVDVNILTVIGANLVDLKIPARIAAHNFDDEGTENYTIQSIFTEGKWVLIELTQTEQTQLELIRQFENQIDTCQDVQQLKRWLQEQAQQIINPNTPGAYA